MWSRARFRSTIGVVLGAALAWACGSRKAPEPSVVAPAASVPSTSSPETSAPLPAGPSLEALPEPVWVSAPRFRITAPRSGQRLTADQAGELLVVVEGSEPGGELRVALDGHAFRAAAESRIPLRRLLLEDEELAPGLHRLIALRETDAGRSVAAAWFRIDASPADANASEESPDAAPPPGVVLAAPSGTFHGDAADGVVLDAFALQGGAFGAPGTQPPAPDRDAVLLVRVTGPSGVAERRTHGQPLRVVGLESGDHQVQALLVEAAGRAVARGPWAATERTITVNRDNVEERGER